MRRAVSGALLFLFALGACAPASDEAASAQGDGFDFWVLALSWSPSYCEAEGPDANRRQCARDLAFVVHGLWPQFEDGWPEFCESGEPERVPDALVRPMLDLIPTAGLIGHQWRKHGACSNMAQSTYFETVRRAHEAVVIPYPQAGGRIDPARVEEAFLAANPGLPADGIAVTCDRSHIREVRICLTTALEFRSCPQVDARACALSSARMPPAGAALR